ncbi:MAG: hypothetical protein RLZZ142_671, partial [Verrucomicrobiota bacterium]
LVAGCCFILPAALLVTVLGWAYVRLGNLPNAHALLYGVKPVLIAVVLQALWGLGRSALKTRGLWAIAGASVVAQVLGVHELGVLSGAGVLAALAGPWRGRAFPGLGTPCMAMVSVVSGGDSAVPAVALGLWPLFLFFLKVGSVLFGSGYVLLAFLRSDLVERWGWLSEGQLLDAIAVGQVTPGPVFTTATFIGYLLAGLPGAALATVGIFLPAFFFVAVSARLVTRLRQSAGAAAFLDGVNAGSLALMAVVTWQLGRVAVSDGLSATLAAASAVGLFRFRMNSAWLVLGGAAIGLLKSQVGP